MLILIAGLRYGIGWDYFNYESMHRIINEGNFYHILIEKKIEFGYVLLNFLIKNLLSSVKYRILRYLTMLNSLTANNASGVSI